MSDRWNKALFSDPIPIAYLAALENVAQTQRWAERQLYYSLWPQQAASSRSSGTSPQAALFPSFYQRLVQGPFSVFLHQQGPKPFTSCYFLHPEFKDTQTGQVAFRVLSKFWGTARWWEGFLIDLPSNIAGCMDEAGQGDAFRERVITEKQFFEKVFFPKIQDMNAGLDVGDRNQLVLHALLSNETALQRLVQENICIPCQPDGRLNRPKRLVHPRGCAAPLYVPDDGRFPQRDEGANFARSDVLKQLSKLGMVKDNVSVGELVKRAESVKTAPANVARERAKAIVKYLSSLEGEMTAYAKHLANVDFLPVMPKPEGWPLPWFGTENFVAPSEGFAKKAKELVGCQAVVLDEDSLDLSNTDRKTLASLRVTASGTKLTEMAVTNLLFVAGNANVPDGTGQDKITDLCKQIYQYLNTVIEKKKDVAVVKRLQDQAVVWSEGQFVTAGRLAFGSSDDLKPYLTMLDSTFRDYRSFFLLLGVKEKYVSHFTLVQLAQL